LSLHPLRGHEEIREALGRARGAGSLPPVLLLHGQPGVGKGRLALWIGQLLLCSSPRTGEPCGACKDCRLAVKLEHPDLHWFFPLPRPRGVSGVEKLGEALEEARNEALREIRAHPLRGGAGDEVRGLYLATAFTLRRKAHRKPSMGERQIFVVTEADLLVPQASSPEAANALLKLLEEPPEGTWFLLTSSRPGSLLPTIRSRSLPLHLAPLPTETVHRFLVEEADADPDAAERAARLSQGSIGRALDLLPREGEERAPLEELRRASFRILQAALEKRPQRAFQLAHSYPVSGARGLSERFAHLEEWLRDLAAAAAGAPQEIVNRDAREYLEKTARTRGIGPLAVTRALAPVDRAREMAEGNVNPQLLVAGLVRELREALVGSPPGGEGPLRRGIRRGLRPGTTDKNGPKGGDRGRR